MAAAKSYQMLWVHAAGLKETNGEQGFVEVEEKVAAKLISDGKACDPRDGAFALPELEPPAPVAEEKKPEPVVIPKSQVAPVAAPAVNTENT